MTRRKGFEMDAEKIREMLESHKKWLNDEPGGCRADLRNADLCGAKSLLSQSSWMNSKFKKDKQGYIVYKGFSHMYAPPKSWEIKAGSFILEVCNPLRTNTCGCGINFGTKKWCKEAGIKKIWKCRIRWEDCAGIVVPYSTDGKARCERLEIIKEVKP